MNTSPVIWLTAFSALMMGAGVVLSVLGTLHDFNRKPDYLKRAETGLIVIQLLSFFSTAMQVFEMLHIPQGEPLPVWTPTVIIRALFFWVPLNFYLYVKQIRKT